MMFRCKFWGCTLKTQCPTNDVSHLANGDHEIPLAKNINSVLQKGSEKKYILNFYRDLRWKSVYKRKRKEEKRGRGENCMVDT